MIISKQKGLASNSKLNFLKDSLFKDLLWIFVVAGIYYLVGSLSVNLAFKVDGITALWPASGIFLSSILLTKKNLRVYLIIVLFIIQFIVDFQGNNPFALCVLFAISLTVEALLSSWIIIRFFGERPAFNSVKQIFIFIVFSLILINVITSCVSSLGLYMFRQVHFWNSWRIWFSADAVGSLLITPFIMSWASFLDNKLLKIRRNQLIELIALFGSMIIVNLLAVINLEQTSDFFIFQNYFAFPFLLWAALRFSLKEVASVSILLTIILISLVQSGTLVMLNSESHFNVIVVLQLSVAISTIISFFLATAITEHKKVEESLLIQKQTLANILEGTNAGTFDWNVQTGATVLNERWAAIMGYSLDELAPIDNNTWINSVHPDDLAVANISMNKLFNKLIDYYDLEFRQLHKNGSWVWINARGKVIEWTKEDKPLIVSGTHLDITERKIAEIELIAARQKAQESDRLKSAFLANMSHEIRTPLNGILGFSELLKEPGLSPGELESYIGIIEQSGKRMLNIINDVIDISKIESGLMRVHLSEIHINEKMQFIYNFFKPEAEAKGIKLSFKTVLPDNNDMLYTDGEKIYAILFNLVKNAIKYTDEGSIEFGYILVETLHTTSQYLEFFVKDTGFGIPEDKMKEIFSRFVQADVADKMAREGAGLGLSISRAYVEMLGGTLWMESKEGKGSTFFFTIPNGAKSTEKTVNEAGIVLNTEAIDKQYDFKFKILIVENDEISGLLISKIVEDISKEILIVCSGAKAIETCLKNADIDLILMDIQMPNINGYEAVRQIRKFNTHVVIIAQTAFGLSGDREKSIEAGCNDYISKPINKNELLALIQGYLKVEFLN